ncbi:MAG TPA: NYN domain-containing protein, partial [Ktedonobacterales bacterium]
MSQTTFDPTAPSGSSDNSAEGRAQGSTPRRRPARRSHAPKVAEGTQTTQATQATQTTQPAAPEHEAPSAAAVAEDQAGRGDNRRTRSRGGAKRPASRGKAGAQLIISKSDEGQSESPAAVVSEPAEAAVVVAATEPTPEPVVVPVTSSSTEAPAQSPAPVRKTRFGLPRRFQQPGATPAAAAAPATPAALVAPVAPASEPAPETFATPEPVVTEPTPEKATPRYRFDRSRGAAAASITTARPERLASQRPGLYTETAKPTEEPVAAPVFDLPSLDALVGAADELPALAFDTPALVKVEPQPTEATEEDHLDEAAETHESAESGEGAAGASRRRRRRRRGSGAHAGGQEGEQDEALEEEAQPTPEPEFEPFEPVATFEPSEPVYTPRETRAPQAESGRGRGGRMGYPSRITRRTPAAEPSWDNEPQQPAADTSPYSSPEPSFARGFGPTPAGVATPVRESYPRPSRVERGVDNGAANTAQLGAVIREAIGTQTDRLLNELRRQQPPSVTLALPSAATTERVAVFVDVANVIYSARNLRTSVDFGHLLDFLRANRRLARAQAYAPTNPEPGAEQAFLSAVKGMGYRITTKNYKTFSNGAKKA